MTKIYNPHDEIKVNKRKTKLRRTGKEIKFYLGRLRDKIKRNIKEIFTKDFVIPVIIFLAIIIVFMIIVFIYIYNNTYVEFDDAIIIG